MSTTAKPACARAATCRSGIAVVGPQAAATGARGKSAATPPPAAPADRFVALKRVLYLALLIAVPGSVLLLALWHAANLLRAQPHPLDAMRRMFNGNHAGAAK